MDQTNPQNSGTTPGAGQTPAPQRGQTPPPAQQPAATNPPVTGQAAASQAIEPKPEVTGTLSVGQGGAHHFVIPPHPNTTFDEAEFLKLLEGSISLTLEEKQKVIEAIPRLNIEQINELIKIFEEEKQKFSELESEYADDVAKLKKERESEFKMAENKQEELSEAEEEVAEAEALKRKLMGGE